MTLLPIALFWALAAWAFLGPSHRLLWLFFAALPFGSFAIVPTGLTAGLTLTPGPAVALILALRVLLTRGGFAALLAAALLPRRMLLLSLFWLVATIVTLFMPSILAGRVMVIPFRGEMLGPTPLAPSPQNVSQLAYLTISVLAAIAFAAALRDPSRRQQALVGLCLGSAVAIATGLLDHAAARVGLAPLLAPFRTASYALLTGDTVHGAKRVVGLMPEASAYGLLCISLMTTLWFFRPAIASARLRERVAPALLALLALCTWLSTSSAAYVGLGLLGFVATAEWLGRALAARRKRPRRAALTEFCLAAGVAAALLLALLVAPGLLEPAWTLIDTMVLQKTASASFAERNFWSATSWAAALQSGGLGVGVGSTRASSSFVGVVSSTGFLGAGLYYGFVLQTLLRRARPGDAEAARLLAAVRWSFLPPFANSLLIGISADFGLGFAFLFGIAGAIGGVTSPLRHPLDDDPAPERLHPGPRRLYGEVEP